MSPQWSRQSSRRCLPHSRMRVVTAFLLLALGILVGGCAWASGASVATATQQQVVDGLTIRLETPATVRVNHQAALVVTLTDAEGRPVAGDVYLDLVMPAHPMGSNQPLATASAAGVYQAASAFTMDGDWTATVVATVHGAAHRAAFTVTVLP